jgi:hypothetical protein
VTPATITPKVHEPLDVHGDFAPFITLNDNVVFDNRPDPVDIVGAQVIAVHLIRQVGLVQNLAGRGQSNAVNVRQRPIHVFVAWQIHTSYTCQVLAP